VNGHSGISYISRTWKLVFLQKEFKTKNINHCSIARGQQESDKFQWLMHHQDGVSVFSYCQSFRGIKVIIRRQLMKWYDYIYILQLKEVLYKTSHQKERGNFSHTRWQS
jgi:hypothetical protein